MKNLGKYLIWLLVLVGVGFAIYTVLPEYPQSVIKSVFQPTFNAVAEERINQVKMLKNKDLDATYGEILDRTSTRSQAWVYEGDDTQERVTFYGSGAYINIKDVEGHDDYLYTSTTVKIEFIIQGGKLIKVKGYIKGEPQQDVIRDLILRQLFTGERV